MQLPRKYNERLQAVFPDRRVRWSNVYDVWMLEQRIWWKRDVDPAKYPAEAVDSFLRFRDGYTLEMEFEPRRLPAVDVLIEFLRWGNLGRCMDALGIKNVDQLHQYQLAKKAEREAQAHAINKEKARDYAGDFYDQLAWMEGRTVTVPRRFEELSVATPTVN